MNQLNELKNSVKYQIYQELHRIFNLPTEDYSKKRKEFFEVFTKRIDAEEEERLIAAARFYTTSYKKKSIPTYTDVFMERYPLIDTDDASNQAAFKVWAAKKNKRPHDDDNADADNADERSYRPIIKINRAAINSSPAPTIEQLVAELQQTNQEIATVASTPTWQTGRSAMYACAMFYNRCTKLRAETERLTNTTQDLVAKAAAFDKKTALLTNALEPEVEPGVAPK